ncbi:hypothetical protein C5748_18100 [Phyllobacterium phragmitis]|uniref:Uncharacterized protein n=1 Tax=Phyllobacterium phragmitis TaxID=2670329 RepID=A0A2S9ING8_9HYPH|nr:hypothetical protein [Phyllobacterium phragmitis]PRD42070.1 hypothetical protein C5748_18100 [Phyllobacterium phragmitis]
MTDTIENSRAAYETAVIERLKESGLLEIEIRVEGLVRCGDGYQDEVINAGWHYWQAGIAAALATPQAPAPQVQNNTELLGYANVYHDNHGNLELGAADIDELETVKPYAAEFSKHVGIAEIRLIAESSGKSGAEIVANVSPQVPEIDRDEVCSKALDDISAERRRQIDVEGWTPEHDDAYVHRDLAKAAACYATGHVDRWPWPLKWWKPSNYRRSLVKAGALILAEIERLDRLAAAASSEGRIDPAPQVPEIDLIEWLDYRAAVCDQEIQSGEHPAHIKQVYAKDANRFRAARALLESIGGQT